MKIQNKEWKTALKNELNKNYYKELMDYLDKEYSVNEVYPPKSNVFQAFDSTPLSEVKVVIIGQDPYHNKNQSHGLCFSVKQGEKTPPSLVNIYKELHADMGCFIPNNGCLQKWADQGVLLLNNVLTVRAHEPHSHRKKGWEKFTHSIIEILNKQDRPMVFILWGRAAQINKKSLNNKNHLVLESPHPSPLSAYQGYFGTNHFSKTNKFLLDQAMDTIDWQIDNI